jgi:hypothetical protein
MDKSWMKLSRVSPAYLEGVERFLDYAFSNTVNRRIPCPCTKCVNRSYQTRDVVSTHLVVKGILVNYVEWVYHGEEYIPREQVNQQEVPTVDSSEGEGADMQGLIEDVAGPHLYDLPEDEGEEIDHEPNVSAKTFLTC